MCAVLVFCPSFFPSSRYFRDAFVKLVLYSRGKANIWFDGEKTYFARTLCIEDTQTHKNKRCFASFRQFENFHKNKIQNSHYSHANIWSTILVQQSKQSIVLGKKVRVWIKFNDLLLSKKKREIKRNKRKKNNQNSWKMVQQKRNELMLSRRMSDERWQGSRTICFLPCIPRKQRANPKMCTLFAEDISQDPVKQTTIRLSIFKNISSETKVQSIIGVIAVDSKNNCGSKTAVAQKN